jgi:hypothetical protein
MKYIDLENYYLCGIGSDGKINRFEVGAYNDKRESFSFSNGSYSSTEIYKKDNLIVTAISLQEIDDAGLLYKYENNI